MNKNKSVHEKAPAESAGAFHTYAVSSELI